ncbi:MAG: NUDIX domain-containing protein, partial [Hyphomicrobiaceae bacterium]
DHIALFLVREWERPVIPEPNAEIQETAFYAVNALPENTVPGAQRRIAEVFDGAKISETW